MAEEEYEEATDGAGGIDMTNGGLDMLGEEDNAMDDIEAKMEVE